MVFVFNTDGHMDCFHNLTIYNFHNLTSIDNATINLRVHVSLCGFVGGRGCLFFVLFWFHFGDLWLLFLSLFIYFERESERMSVGVGEGQRERERIPSKLQAVSTQTDT